MRDIVVTLPASVKWEEYEKELEQVRDGEMYLNFKVSNLPKESGVGAKCYVVHKGFVRGWMEIVGFSCDDDFFCEFTGEHWEGNFIERSGEFHYIDPIPMKGFQGFKYFN